MSVEDHTPEQLERAEQAVALVDPIAEEVCASIRSGADRISELDMPELAVGPGLFSYLMNLQCQIEIMYDAILREDRDETWGEVVAEFRDDHPEAFIGEIHNEH